LPADRLPQLSWADFDSSWNKPAAANTARYLPARAACSQRFDQPSLSHLQTLAALPLLTAP
jgi:hypothetical protein